MRKIAKSSSGFQACMLEGGAVVLKVRLSLHSANSMQRGLTVPSPQHCTKPVKASRATRDPISKQKMASLDLATGHC